MGLLKALASAWLGAIVARTCVVTPSMTEHATAFFTNREREIVDELRKQSRRFLSDAAAAHQHAFWDERADEPGAQVGQEVVQRAFEAIRSRERLHAQRGPNAHIEPRPCVRGNQIVLEPHIVWMGADVRYVRGVDMTGVLELAPLVQSVPDLFESYRKRYGAAELPDFLFALASAFANGWLVAE